ncbi:hypothetical protein QRB41_28245 [Mycobacterium avium subsp. hominissuis]|uniref:hypothetical protein n=1 Tax=Mycobacterium avium TaxID=1764 RepID=UPI0026656DC3|nr:hypothetical protein [Mycobacterium avium]MDO2387183.1 hypothetical protein [Mycobacterium avium subsp. hominissuis]
MGVTLRELIFLPPDITDLAKATRAMATNHAQSAEFYRSLVRLSGWQGRAADTAAASMLGVATQHDTHAEDLNAAAAAMDRCEADAESVANKVRDLLTFAAERPAVQVNEDTNTVTPPDTSYLDKAAAQQVAEKVAAVEEQVTKVLSEGAVVDGELAQAIAKATGVPAAADSPKTLQDLLLPGLPGPAAPPPADRRSNQAAAFRTVYGRDPVSANDWMMAAGLDPHSYMPKNRGVPPEIVAGRFAPQPGKGVVRSNMFIPTDEVVNTAKDLTDAKEGRLFPMNFGDNRGPSAYADAEASRVSMFVDYDHGVVVVRQNPTSAVDGERGGALAAVPEVHVVQAPDGRMTVDYNAYDAYENPVGKALGITVNGRVTFDPQADGAVALGGNTTIYPSMETYQYRDGVPPEVLQWTPANSGSDVGPGTSLSRHHWIGDATIPQVRPNMPDWKWELENLNPFGGDPFTAHTTRLTDPFNGSLPTVGMGH